MNSQIDHEELSTGLSTESNSRSGLSRASGPILGLAATLGAATFIGLVNPSTSNAYPLCPTQAILGVDCPGCGGLRCIHELMNGNIGAALDQNLVLVFLLPIILIAFAAAIAKRIKGQQTIESSYSSAFVSEFKGLGISVNQKLLMYILIGIVIVYTVARNLPFVPFLGSGIG